LLIERAAKARGGYPFMAHYYSLGLRCSLLGVS
jgi:hypothetical protein